MAEAEKRKKPVDTGFEMVEMRRLELLTPYMRRARRRKKTDKRGQAQIVNEK
jgi:hypothetical protein